MRMRCTSPFLPATMHWLRNWGWKTGSGAVQALHDVEEIPHAVLPVGEAQAGDEGARHVEVPVVDEELVANADDEVPVAQPGRVPDRMGRQLADADLPYGSPGRALVEVVEPHLGKQQDAVGEADGKDGLRVRRRRPIQVLDTVLYLEFLGVFETGTTDVPDGNGRSIGIYKGCLLHSAAAHERGLRDARLHGRRGQPLDLAPRGAYSSRPKLNRPEWVYEMATSRAKTSRKPEMMGVEPAGSTGST